MTSRAPQTYTHSGHKIQAFTDDRWAQERVGAHSVGCMNISDGMTTSEVKPNVTRTPCSSTLATVPHSTCNHPVTLLFTQRERKGERENRPQGRGGLPDEWLEDNDAEFHAHHWHTRAAPNITTIGMTREAPSRGVLLHSGTTLH